ncbi:C45 family autoproteolytic acyltransferase/hydrolase [Microbacterium sp. RD1]|uniref:C45 family autoproteolytic acyltransferase/hydolase n=1 Tax=Microbacterium sp. RD1 TaxID=3457313 RepID=UPI003FA5FEE7
MTDVGAPIMVDIAGDGRSRGEAHGEALRSLIADGLERWRHHVGERHGVTPRTFVERFLTASEYVATVERVAPDLYAEVAGIAAASNQPLSEVWAYNLMDEEWRYQHDQGVGCSVIGMTSDPDGAGVVLGQNMDLPSSMSGNQALLRIAESHGEPTQIVLTAAGMVGLLGVNRAGVACCVNTLEGLPGSLTGLPVAFVVREVLRQPNADEAVARLVGVPHASGQHYAIADSRGIRGFECSAEACVEGPAASGLVHTNHALWVDSPAAHERAWGSPTTLPRLRALDALLAAVSSGEEVEAALSDPTSGLCVRPTIEVATETFAGVMFTLPRSAQPSVRIALGRPDRTPWRDVPWEGQWPTPAE